MQAGASHGILNLRGRPFFQTVNALMLRSVILVNTPDILHPGDQGHIGQKNSKTDNTFQYGKKGSISDIGMEQKADTVRQRNENSHCKHNGKGYG